MTNILAIDTSTAACSVALWCEGDLISRFQLASREHTQLILPMVDDVLSEAGKKLSQLEALAFTAGPGSFTGIRIGFGVVQGLAFGADLPVLPVSTLETFAYTALRRLNLSEGDHLLPMLDARMDEIYWGLYEVADGRLNRLSPDSLNSPESVVPECLDIEKTVVGDGWNYADRLSIDASYVEPTLLPDARDAITIALPAWKVGAACSIDEVQPVYLRDKITWKKRQRLRQG